MTKTIFMTPIRGKITIWDRNGFPVSGRMVHDDVSFDVRQLCEERDRLIACVVDLSSTEHVVPPGGCVEIELRTDTVYRPEGLSMPDGWKISDLTIGPESQVRDGLVPGPRQMKAVSVYDALRIRAVNASAASAPVQWKMPCTLSI